jgi:hypothetical protein
MKTIIIGLLGWLLASVAYAQLVQSPSASNKTSAVLVGSLPTCNAGNEGLIYGVTDALTPVVLSAVAGGGAIHTLVYCNGTSWIVG